MLKNRALAAVAIAAAAVLAIGSAAPATAVSPAGGLEPYNVVALGDSYTAGNGAGAYYGSSEARRSHNNYASKYTQWLAAQPGMHLRYSSFAHSGNTTVEVLNEQIAQVPADTNLVLFTIGGNDVGFQNIVTYCFAMGFRSASDCREKVDAARAEIPTVRAQTERILQRLSEKLGPDAEIIIVGYPYLSLNTGYTLCDYVLLCFSGHSYEAAKAVRQLTDAASAMQASLVSEWNSRPGVPRAYHANGVSAAFGGHEPQPNLTEGNNGNTWINEFWQTEGYQDPLGSLTRSSFSADKLNWFHPNITGHAQVAEVIKSQIGITAGGLAIQTRNQAATASATGPSALSFAPFALSEPSAWLGGPYVQAVGSSIAFDARGSVPSEGAIESYEWDLDGDGVFDITTTEPSYEHTFAALFSGTVSVRVTQTDGGTAIASTEVLITDDGDSTPPELDNCPSVANYSQSDEDDDGIGDECDPAPGHPAEDLPGVYAVDESGVPSREGVDPRPANEIPENSDGTSVTAPPGGAAGATIPFAAAGFVPGDEAEVLLWNGRAAVALGDAVVADDGTVTGTTTLPADTAAGAYRLFVVAPAMLASAPLTVNAASTGTGGESGSGVGGSTPADPAAAGTGSAAQRLAQSGGEDTAWIGAAGALILAAGGLLLGSRLRLRSRG